MIGNQINMRMDLINIHLPSNLSEDGGKNMQKFLKGQPNIFVDQKEISPIESAIEELKQEGADLVKRSEVLQKGLAEIQMSLDMFEHIMGSKTPTNPNEVATGYTIPDAHTPLRTPGVPGPIEGLHGPILGKPGACFCGCSLGNPCLEEECLHCGPDKLPWGKEVL